MHAHIHMPANSLTLFTERTWEQHHTNTIVIWVVSLVYTHREYKCHFLLKELQPLETWVIPEWGSRSAR